MRTVNDVQTFHALCGADHRQPRGERFEHLEPRTAALEKRNHQHRCPREFRTDVGQRSRHHNARIARGSGPQRLGRSCADQQEPRLGTGRDQLGKHRVDEELRRDRVRHVRIEAHEQQRQRRGAASARIVIPEPHRIGNDVNRCRRRVQLGEPAFVFTAAQPELVDRVHRMTLDHGGTRRDHVANYTGLQISTARRSRELAQQRRLDVVAVQDAQAAGRLHHLDVPIQPQSFDDDDVRAERLDNGPELPCRRIRVIEVRRMPVRIEQPRPAGQADALRWRIRQSRIGG